MLGCFDTPGAHLGELVESPGRSFDNRHLYKITLSELYKDMLISSEMFKLLL